MRVGMPDSLLTLIQKPSVSISPPASSVTCTRMFVHRVDSPEHQRRSRTVDGQAIGWMTSMMVRRTIHHGSVSMKNVACRFSHAMSCR